MGNGARPDSLDQGKLLKVGAVIGKAQEQHVPEFGQVPGSAATIHRDRC